MDKRPGQKPRRSLANRAAAVALATLVIATTAVVVKAAPAAATLRACYENEDGYGNLIFLNGFGGWCDGTGPSSYRAWTYCQDGHGLRGQEKRSLALGRRPDRFLGLLPRRVLRHRWLPRELTATG